MPSINRYRAEKQAKPLPANNYSRDYNPKKSRYHQTRHASFEEKQWRNMENSFGADVLRKLWQLQEVTNLFEELVGVHVKPQNTTCKQEDSEDSTWSKKYQRNIHIIQLYVLSCVLCTSSYTVCSFVCFSKVSALLPQKQSCGLNKE